MANLVRQIPNSLFDSKLSYRYSPKGVLFFRTFAELVFSEHRLLVNGGLQGLEGAADQAVTKLELTGG